MSEPNGPVCVRYSKPFLGALIVLGIVLVTCGVALRFGDLPGNSVLVVLGALLVVLPPWYLRSTYFVYSPTLRTVSMSVNRYQPAGQVWAGGDARATIDGGWVVLVRPDGSRRRLPAHRIVADRTGWEQFVQQLAPATDR